VLGTRSGLALLTPLGTGRKRQADGTRTSWRERVVFPPEDDAVLKNVKSSELEGATGLDGGNLSHGRRDRPHRRREWPTSAEHGGVAPANPHSPLSPSNPGAPINPVLVRHAEQRAQNLQARIADAITKFAGSMPFVYVHILWFVLWIGFRIEKFPFGLLTMIVSLEAIFLSTFVMISQNRADEKRQVLADQQWQTVQEEDQQNVQLLTISKQILDLTTAIHSKTVEAPKAQADAGND